MPRVIISDTSCFITLSNIGQLDLLKNIYGEITTTSEVVQEYGAELPEWVEVLSPKDLSRQELLELHIDRGEASAIALALELKASLIILDDYKARKAAVKLGLTITGTIGVIVRAKKNGIIKSLIPILNDLKETNFRFSKELEESALREAGEL
ncbi:MAG: DUF3368 domain-containing protein [Cyclobacteriaceae bacterium]